MIKADTAPKEPGLAATLKTNNGQRSEKGKQRSKSHPIVWHVSFACSPQRLSVSVNTSNTQYLHKTQRTQLLAIHIISSRNRDMDPSQRSLPAEVPMIKQRFVVWLFSPKQNLLLGANWVDIVKKNWSTSYMSTLNCNGRSFFLFDYLIYNQNVNKEKIYSVI